MQCCRFLALALVLAMVPFPTARGDGPADNRPEAVRRIPKLGIEVPPEVRTRLETGLTDLNGAIERVRAGKDQRRLALLPDVEVFAKAVHDALAYQEFFAPGEFKKADSLLAEGIDRARSLEAGKAPWTERTGLVIRGHVSRIDGSVQPYGLVIPEDYDVHGATRSRLDVWFHGRGETLSELNFLDERRRQVGVFAPAGTIVLHPYGRYSNAFKFAGEVDVLEAIEAVKTNYRIDPDRIAVRGFSMGGAACWQFAVHYSDRWFAANPGAGFAETARFLDVFQKETLAPPGYEKKLWNLYDCDVVAANLKQCPTVAYSGEIDSQKQAADVMAEALKAEGIELLHVIGPQTKHQYHPRSKIEVERRLESLAEKGRQRYPSQIDFSTFTLKYNTMGWVTIDALNQHWNKSRVRADKNDNTINILTDNVAALTLDFPAGWSPFSLGDRVLIFMDGQPITGPAPFSDRSWRLSLHREQDVWKVGELPKGALRKRHDLQGPIDDAFMDRFVFVRPTGKSRHPVFQKWVEQEQNHAIEHWRRHFRGIPRVKDDTAVSDDDIGTSHLILWGDTESNAVLKKIAGQLPIGWTGAEITAGTAHHPSDHHALILIAPNPLNPARYVVLNSGFTFREYDYLNNARQVPKLPDWAIIDLNTPADSRYPGKVVNAGFFGEDWKLEN